MKRYRLLWANDRVWCVLIHVSVVMAAVVVLRMIVDQSRTYVFYEYALKFVPFLLDAKPTDFFDAWAMGDPRPRLINVVAAWLSIHFRGFLSDFFTIPPAMGLNWLVYPAVVFCLYSLVKRLTKSRNIALGSAIIWGASPPALDSLVCCYVPAKILMNLWFVAAGFAAAIYADRINIAPHPESGVRNIRGPLFALSAVTLAALLTDETSVFIVLCIPILFAPGFGFSCRLWRPAIAAWASLVLPVALYLVVALVLYPTANRLFGQVPLHFISASLRGPTVALVGSSAASPIAPEHIIGRFSANFQPLGLAYTMFAAHLIPNRLVPGYWTLGHSLGPRTWPLWETGVLCAFFSASIALASRLPPELFKVTLRIAMATAVMIAAYAVLLVPLGPAILEVAYYGALFSIPFAIGTSVLILGEVPGVKFGMVAIAVVAGIAALEMLGYEETAKRTNEYFDTYFTADGRAVHGTPERSWSTISFINKSVRSGGFDDIAAVYPYPTRNFIYAFELEAWRRHRLGEKVDFQPMAPAESLYSRILDEHLLWTRFPNSPALNLAIGLNAKQFEREGAVPVYASALEDLIHNKTWHGSGRQWTFTFSFDQNGEFVGRYWLNPVIRVWRESGSVSVRHNFSLEIRGTKMGAHSTGHVYRFNGSYFVFDQQGKCLFAFELIPPVNI